MPNDELWTVDELASYLKLKPQTLYPKVRKGEIPVIKVFGSYRFRKSDIDNWLSGNEKARQNKFRNITTEIQQPIESQV